jgi:hypothetical protein
MIVNSLGQIAPNTVHDHGVALVSPRAEGYVAAQVREVGAEDDTVDSDDIAQQAQHQVTPERCRFQYRWRNDFHGGVEGVAVLSIR